MSITKYVRLITGYRIRMVVLILFMSSCSLTDLDKLDNPNAIGTEHANVDFLYNSIQQNFGVFFHNVSFRAGQPARMFVLVGGATYEDILQAPLYNRIWDLAYAQILPDIEAVLKLAEDQPLDIHAGSCLILKAYILLSLVDMFGNVPLMEAGKGIIEISPGNEDGREIYSKTEIILNEAIDRLKKSSAPKPLIDLFYNGDSSGWIRLAQTLKMKIYLQTRLVDPDTGSKFSQVIAEHNFIQTEAEDFQFEFSMNRTNPDSRHPFYSDVYERGGFISQTNYLMWLLKGNKRDAGGNVVVDPRIRFYFYRQTLEPPGCFPETPPSHYLSLDPNMPVCLASLDGYWGSDHLRFANEVTHRAIFGMYPVGGKFDDDSFELFQDHLDGALGQGIYPIILSSFVYFMRAEMALMGGTGEDPREMLEKGMRESAYKVFSFSKLVDDPTVDEFLVDFQDEVSTYVNHVLLAYDSAASDEARLDIIIKEYYIAAFGNGLEVYNNLRRTLKPENIQPPYHIPEQTFIWSAFYPADHVNRSSKVVQKILSEKVFWDTNPVDALN